MSSRAPIQPILANACAQAATAEEAAYRINREIGGRKALIVALDPAASDVVDRVAERPWGAARFFGTPELGPVVAELGDADVTIVVATADADGEAASALARAGAERGIMLAGLILGEQREVGGAASELARACAQRGIMLAGLILGERLEVAAAVAALRPYARNLMITEDEDDVAAVLTALRA